MARDNSYPPRCTARERDMHRTDLPRVEKRPPPPPPLGLLLLQIDVVLLLLLLFDDIMSDIFSCLLSSIGDCVDLICCWDCC